MTRIEEDALMTLRTHGLTLAKLVKRGRSYVAVLQATGDTIEARGSTLAAAVESAVYAWRTRAESGGAS